MNNDFTPTPAAGPSSSSRNVDNNGDTPAAAAETSQQQHDNERGSVVKTKEFLQTKKTYEFIDALMNNLDTLIYVELCVCYYMDCSFFRLLIRILAQAIFLTPKPAFIPPMPKHRPYIGAIFGPNLLCLLLHLFTARSEASEAMRGYLHGGIIIDLIGQKGPTSKLHLVMLDGVVMVLQCFMLAVHVERERLMEALKGTSTCGELRSGVVSGQDIDAEERGVRRNAVTSEGDIEMETLPPSSGNQDEEGGDINEDRERLLAELAPNDDRDEDDSPLDVFWSGTAVIADFHVLQTLRAQWDDYGNATASALQTVGFSAEFAAVTSNRQINAASRRLQRGVERFTASP